MLNHCVLRHTFSRYYYEATLLILSSLGKYSAKFSSPRTMAFDMFIASALESKCWRVNFLFIKLIKLINLLINIIINEVGRYI